MIAPSTQKLTMTTLIRNFVCIFHFSQIRAKRKYFLKCCFSHFHRSITTLSCLNPTYHHFAHSVLKTGYQSIAKCTFSQFETSFTIFFKAKNSLQYLLMISDFFLIIHSHLSYVCAYHNSKHSKDKGKKQKAARIDFTHLTILQIKVSPTKSYYQTR